MGESVTTPIIRTPDGCDIFLSNIFQVMPPFEGLQLMRKFPLKLETFLARTIHRYETGAH
jgi:hypothetical protein